MIVLVGLTGGIACGKSTVSEILAREHGAVIIDADAIVRELQAPGSRCVRRIAAAWPEAVDPATLTLDRAALGAIVFKDADARRRLGRIMNGPIFRAILGAIARAWVAGLAAPRRLVVLDAPTLFETRLFTLLISSALVVAAEEGTQLRRLAERNGLPADAALARVRAQMPLEEKRRRADLVIENDGDDMERLRRDVAAAAERLRAGSGWRLDCIFGTVAVLGALAAEVTIALLIRTIF